MKRHARASAIASALALAACAALPGAKPDPIIGAWFVKAPGAPFAYHVMIFSADGTMQQANPEAGDAGHSDSDGMGVWVRDGDHVKGKFVEIMADRATRQFASRGEISFDLQVEGDAFTGAAAGRFYDAAGKMIRGPLTASLEGQRVRPE